MKNFFEFVLRTVLGIGLITAALGCGGSHGGDSSQQLTQSPDDLLANATETLREATPTVAIYDNTVQQLNSYLDAVRQQIAKLPTESEERKKLEQRIDMRFDPVERELIEKDKDKEKGLIAGLARLDREEWLRELDRPTFTKMDAHHLDACFLFRDAASSIKYEMGREIDANDPAFAKYQLQLAQRALEWVVRQVYLQPPEPNREPWPAHEVLRRGTGSAEERARVFLALAEQLGLKGCIIARTIEEEKTEDGEKRRETREEVWIPGLLIGKELTLFDTNVGLPIPGPGGSGVATLRQARADPAILKNIGSDVTAEQLKKPALLIPTVLQSSSPRMRYLQRELDNAENPVILYKSLAAALKDFRDANLDADVRLWTSRQGYPAIVLARYVNNPLNQPRLQDSIVPRSVAPFWAQQIVSQPGPAFLQKLREARVFRAFDNLFLRVRIEPGGARDLLVRGQPDQAIHKILATETTGEGSLDKVLDSHQKMGGDMTTSARDEWQKYLAIERQFAEVLSGRGASTQADEDIRSLTQRLEANWKNQAYGMFLLAHEWAAPELREHLNYFMAVAKMEQATRAGLLAASAKKTPGSRQDELTGHDRWESAATWLVRYQAMVLPRPRNQWGNSVRFHLAACRAAQGQFGAAVAALDQVQVDANDASKETRYLRQARQRLVQEYKLKQGAAAAAGAAAGPAGVLGEIGRNKPSGK